MGKQIGIETVHIKRTVRKPQQIYPENAVKQSKIIASLLTGHYKLNKHISKIDL